MAKTKELSQQLCMVIIDHHNCGMGYRKICDVVKIPISRIGAIIWKWKEHGLTTNLPRKGHPRKVSDAQAIHNMRRTSEGTAGSWHKS